MILFKVETIIQTPTLDSVICQLLFWLQPGERKHNFSFDILNKIINYEGGLF